MPQARKDLDCFSGRLLSRLEKVILGFYAEKTPIYPFKIRKFRLIPLRDLADAHNFVLSLDVHKLYALCISSVE